MSDTTFFDQLSATEIARVRAAGTQVTMPAQWSPIGEQTPADKAYVILSGTVSVRRHGIEVARLGVGDIMGEMAIVNHSLRNATLVSLTRLELLHLTTEAVRTLSAQLPAFRAALDHVSGDRSAA